MVSLRKVSALCSVARASKMSKMKRLCPQVDLQQQTNCWVSLHPESHAAIAGGASLKEVRQAAIRQGVQHPLLMMVPESFGFFAGYGQPLARAKRTLPASSCRK